MPTKIFSLTATSFELRCQCPLVTPASLNGNGCAAAVPTARTVDASNKLANNVVFIKPSLLNRYAVEPVRPCLSSPACRGARKDDRIKTLSVCVSVRQRGHAHGQAAGEQTSPQQAQRAS